MAKGFKSGGKNWQPGQSGNSKGRPALPAELHAIKKLTPAYIKAVIAKLAQMTPQEMMSYVEGGSGNNMEYMVASIIMKATTDGDHNKLNFLLDRTIGKVVEQHKVTLEPVTYKTTITPDGNLFQEVISEEVFGETIDMEKVNG